MKKYWPLQVFFHFVVKKDKAWIWLYTAIAHRKVRKINAFKHFSFKRLFCGIPFGIILKYPRPVFGSANRYCYFCLFTFITMFVSKIISIKQLLCIFTEVVRRNSEKLSYNYHSITYFRVVFWLEWGILIVLSIFLLFFLVVGSISVNGRNGQKQFWKRTP